METICGKRTHNIDADTLANRAAGASAVLVDIGTGDGRYVLQAARAGSSWFAIGVDACRENMRTTSRTAPRNALFIIADARVLPDELHGLATQIAINFPWGSLLGGLLDGDAGLLGGLASLARPNPAANKGGATLEIRLNGGALAEAGLSLQAGGERVRQVLVANGFSVGRPALLDARALRACPTTWAKRLAFGHDPRALYVRAIVSVAERYGFEEDLEDDTDFEVDPPGGNGLHPA